MAILVGSLPSREGRAALQVAVDECLVRGADLVLVGLPDGGRGFEDHEKDAWQVAVRQAEERMTQGGKSITLRDEAGDDVAHSLVQIAEETKAELIVIGLRRRTPVGKLLLGSNAQRVLLEAGCPVLAVKAPEDD
ncbi:MAG: universal stress protein [Austwickia sp.]|nr:universal stress protein [Actinomycetota bacterium]MCB1252510.1 universal stress protein [Austwickia sp.]